KYHILMTRRTNHLKNHSGEISFPGGSKDKKDVTFFDTAIREMEEEVGIDKSYIEIIGILQDEFSVTYYTVKPIVIYINNFHENMLRLDTNEVEKVLLIPLDFFLDGSHEWRELWLRNNEKHINFFYNFNGEIIWGLSGRIIKTFIQLVKKCTISSKLLTPKKLNITTLKPNAT
ncbi:MAG: CoA pyrophosphatase, partial [Calditerrivibrio sp.]|nr:CoA pyrophosphatase [Calditerrivibrio sp.]